VKLWERANASSDDFVEMVDLSQHGGLPSRGQSLTLSVWEWRGDGIYFLGATQDTQIRLRLPESVSRFYDATSPVLVRNAQEAIAYATAALAVGHAAARWQKSGTKPPATRWKTSLRPQYAASSSRLGRRRPFQPAAVTRHFDQRK